MTAKFWWRQTGRESGIHWKNWNSLTKSKRYGGLGFRDLHAMNVALVAKQVWRLEHNQQSLWGKLIKNIYYPNCSIWEAKKKRLASWGWQSILQGRDFINMHKGWLIKDGVKARVFNDKWIQDGSRVWSDSNSLIQLPVSYLLTDDGRDWDVRKLVEILPREVTRKVAATQINHHLPYDTPMWPFTKNGVYTVKTGYHLAWNDLKGASLPSSSDTADSSHILSTVWKAKVQPKIQHFIWHLLTNAIPTKDNLARRRVGADNLCPVS